MLSLYMPTIFPSSHLYFKNENLTWHCGGVDVLEKTSTTTGAVIRWTDDVLEEDGTEGTNT